MGRRRGIAARPELTCGGTPGQFRRCTGRGRGRRAWRGSWARGGAVAVVGRGPEGRGVGGPRWRVEVCAAEQGERARLGFCGGCGVADGAQGGREVRLKEGDVDLGEACPA
jgi:hypothetical protein